MHSLSGDQVERLVDGLKRSFDIDELRIFLRTRVDLSLDKVSAPGKADPVRMFEMVEHSQRHDWVCKLLSNLVTDGPNDELKALAGDIMAEVCDGPGPAGNGARHNPFAACVVGRRTIVDRERLRDHMREIGDDRARLLLIQGPEATGKSLSWYFIQHLSHQLDGVRAKLVDLKQWKRPRGPTPDDVMDKIASQLAVERSGWPAEDLAQGARRADKLVDWFCGKSEGLGGRVWLVLDHLDREDLREETLDLAEKLAVAVDTRNCENVTLVLIGYPGTLSDIEPFVLLRDETSAVTESEVRLHFKNLAAQCGRVIPEPEIDDLVAEAFAGLARPLDREKMHHLAGRLAGLSARVARGQVNP